MKYLCLIFLDELKLHALSSDELQALDRDSLAYDNVLREGGHLLAAQALRSVREAVTIRTQSGKASVTDGPFAEARANRRVYPA